jgi:CBS domain-containing protein
MLQIVTKRRAWGSNPQPVSRHLISSQAASHSLTLRAIHLNLLFAPAVGKLAEIVSYTSLQTAPPTPENASMDRLDRKRRQLITLFSQFLQQEPINPVSVAEVMTSNPACISPEATLLDLVKLFHAREFRHPLVTDAEGNLVGVVSDRDVIRCFGPGRYPEEDVLKAVTAAEIMSTDLVTISPAAPLEQAIDLICGYGINCLPVVAGRKLVGILTSTDLYVVLEMLLKTFQQSRPARAAELAAANR